MYVPFTFQFGSRAFLSAKPSGTADDECLREILLFLVCMFCQQHVKDEVAAGKQHNLSESHSMLLYDCLLSLLSTSVLSGFL